MILWWFAASTVPLDIAEYSYILQIMWFDFRWIEFNEARIAEHGITTEECEWVVCHVRPRQSGTTLIAEGQTQAGRDIRVIYTMDDAMTVFVIIAYEV